ncbi:MAG: hypothetical protein KKC80_01500 [Candidatus Margulisbacteria bacterium]|nr:hypothetical protein [Candidatus Margulisiibacteriota bacterium]MBU1616739.1 hypothetical protein [Candidatus Margulisiibacteriota bacterium]
MRKKRLPSIFVLGFFLAGLFFQPGPAFAADNTGTIKIFSEVKGIEIFLDEKSQGQDMVELYGVDSGSHYLKATKDSLVIFSELVNVAPNATTTVLIKDTGQVKAKLLESKSKEQDEYKNKKLDILLSKSVHTVGKEYTTSMYFPGYYSVFGSGWSNMSSTAYETADWKIVQGGVQQISDVEFARLVNDGAALKIYEEKADFYTNKYNIGAVVGLIGVLSLAGGAFTTGDTQIGLLTLGLVGCVFGLGFMAEEAPPPQHLISAGEAAKQAYDYNRALKIKLGLPEDYEP